MFYTQVMVRLKVEEASETKKKSKDYLGIIIRRNLNLLRLHWPRPHFTPEDNETYL